EVWSHANDESCKFRQFGWRCTTTESAYSTRTLIGNWSEHRYDLSLLRETRPILSPYAHNFQTTSREAHTFPGHQPELDNAVTKAAYNSFETESRATFIQTEAGQE
ncbi:PREDICTED: UPF0686 protein C11orf1 homolog, partial [Priapulus caudatus]|uniref:UPF0686 protein C11orf1 homolog n=1 Tax=Priapulus caudatus TaxID=37621 RepID=A0ABM1F752_PRICU